MLKFTESTGKLDTGGLEKVSELPVKLSKSRKIRQVVDLIFQTSVDRPRNAETDEIS